MGVIDTLVSFYVHKSGYRLWLAVPVKKVLKNFVRLILKNFQKMPMTLINSFYNLAHIFISLLLFSLGILILLSHHKNIHLGIQLILLELQIFLVCLECHNKRLLMIFLELIMLGKTL